MNIIEHARKMRAVIERAAQYLDDAIALTAIALHPEWAEGTDYTVGYKVQHNCNLYRCIQSHTALVGWEPENAAALWEQINETHTGELDDPIPYSGNMALENGKHYIENDAIYLCIRDTGNPVYNSLVELVGIYVETT